ncbi:MAG: hypothetical protein ACYDA9_01615 [Terriglobia bacterium]
MTKAAPKFERISLAELKARLPAVERRRLGMEIDGEDEPVNESGGRRPKNLPGTNGQKRNGKSKK